VFEEYRLNRGVFVQQAKEFCAAVAAESGDAGSIVGHGLGCDLNGSM
jgi:hypothetical protein